MDIQHQKSWWGRNWLWVVPVGGCLTLIVLFIFGIGAALFGVSEVLKGSEPYEYAIEEARNDSEVIAILGEPIQTSGMMEGTVNFKNDSGRVNLEVPIRGPNGTATVKVKGEKEDGEWTYEELYVTIEKTDEKINLLDNGLDEN